MTKLWHILTRKYYVTILKRIITVNTYGGISWMDGWMDKWRDGIDKCMNEWKVFPLPIMVWILKLWNHRACIIGSSKWVNMVMLLGARVLIGEEHLDLIYKYRMVGKALRGWTEIGDQQNEFVISHTCICIYRHAHVYVWEFYFS